MRVLNLILFLSREGPVGQHGQGSGCRATVGRFRWSLHGPKSVGGGRRTQSLQHGLCDFESLLLRRPRPARPERAARAVKSIIPMNFPSKTSRLAGVDGVENHSQKVLGGSNDPFPRKSTLSAQSPSWI